MRALTEYMTAVDGSRSWDAVEPLFEAAFHPEATVETADGVLDRGQWKEMAQGLVERGAVITDFEIEAGEADSAKYRLTLTVGEDAPLELAAVGRFEDGRLIHVAPVDPSSYSELVARA